MLYVSKRLASCYAVIRVVPVLVPVLSKHKAHGVHNRLVNFRGDAFLRVTGFKPTAEPMLTVEIEQYQIPDEHVKKLVKYKAERRRDNEIVSRIK